MSNYVALILSLAAPRRPSLRLGHDGPGQKAFPTTRPATVREDFETAHFLSSIQADAQVCARVCVVRVTIGIIEIDSRSRGGGRRRDPKVKAREMTCTSLARSILGEIRRIPLDHLARDGDIYLSTYLFLTRERAILVEIARMRRMSLSSKTVMHVYGRAVIILDVFVQRARCTGFPSPLYPRPLLARGNEARATARYVNCALTYAGQVSPGS